MMYRISILALLGLQACGGVSSFNLLENDARRDPETRKQIQGNTVGNGGDAVVCTREGQITSVELLDFYEARVMYGLQPLLGSAQDVVERVQYALSRLSSLDSDRRSRYQQMAEVFFDEANILYGTPLPDIEDSGDTILPDHCKLEQLVIQKEPSLPHEKRYIINGDLWALLDVDHRAGVVLHEIIYRDALSRGHLNSVKARYFNGVLCSEYLNILTQDEYAALIKQVEMNEMYQYIDGTITYRYYPVKVDYDTAINFCTKLDGVSRIWQSGQTSRARILSSAIGEVILSDVEPVDRILWTWDSGSTDPEGPFVFTFDEQDINDPWFPRLASADERHGFICELENRL